MAPVPDRPARAKADDGAVGAGPSEAGAPLARSADGDTFTLSVEARVIQVTESVTIESDGDCARPGEADRLARHGQVEGLMEALDRSHGHGRRHGYPRLADAEDVASRIAEDWDREFAARGGSRRDFAEALRQRLDRWRDAGSGARRMTLEHSEFHSEVAVRITERLGSWAEDGAAPAPEASGLRGLS